MATASTSKSVRAVFSDSESSGDEGLVNPNEIDFNSEFFNVKANDQENQPQTSAPVFDCNAGVNLSDSSDSDDEDFSEVPAQSKTDSPKKSSVINKINTKSTKEMHDFSSLHSFAKNLESAKNQLQKLKQKEANAAKLNTDESDVTKLLSLGEGPSTSAGASRKRKHKDGGQHSDDSDWENVSGKKRAKNS